MKDLPVEVKNYRINDRTTEDGVRILSTQADIERVNYTTAIFDESHLSLEELDYLQFYCQMLNNRMPTTTRTEEQVKNDISNNAYAFAPVIATIDDKNAVSATPVLSVSFYGMEGTYSQGMELVSDLLLNSNLKQGEEYIKRTITNMKAGYSSYLADPYLLACYRALGLMDEEYRYNDYLNGLEYYQFLLKLEKDFKENKTAVINQLIAVRDKAFSREDMTLMFTGNSSSMAKFNQAKDTFIAKFPQIKTEPVSHEFPVLAKKEAWIANSDAQYVIWGSSLKDANVTYDGSMITMTSLLNDGYLIPTIRFNGGAYTVGADIDEKFMQVFSYRDLNYVNSLEAIDQMDDYMAQVSDSITKETLDSYIVASFAQYSVPKGALAEASSALYQKLANYTVEDKNELLEQIKNTSLEKADEYAKTLKKLVEKGCYVVVTNRSGLKGNEKLFDEVIELN